MSVIPPNQMSNEERTWGIACHLAALAVYIVPFGNIIGPLVVWLMKKNQYPFVDDQGKQSLNFQISFTIYGLGVVLLSIPFIILTVGFGLFLIIPLIWLISLIVVIFAVIAAIAASKGEAYRYPLTIMFVK